MAKALRVYRAGGPEVMEARDVPPVALTRRTPEGSIRIRHEAVGVNFTDVLHLKGKCRDVCWFPFTPGFEAAGYVIEVGENIKRFKVGDRVAYVSGQRLGSYCSERTIDESAVLHLPADVSFETAAAGLFKGIVAYQLLNDYCPVQKDDKVLIHAAAGGIGCMLSQLLSQHGAFVIGTIGSPGKEALARDNGCHASIVYTEEDFVPAVMYATMGEGVHAVFDGVGGRVSERSLLCLRRGGCWVRYGMSSGEASAVRKWDVDVRGIEQIVVDVSDVTLPNDKYQAVGQHVLEMLRDGTLKARIGQRYNLLDGRQALQDLMDRKTCGSTVLIPPPLMPVLFDVEIMDPELNTTEGL